MNRNPPDSAIGPLSLQQEQLWFAERLGAQRGAYNEARSFAIRGPLDRGALERSFAALVARHPLLRSVFSERDTTPVRTRLPCEAFAVAGRALAAADDPVEAARAFCETPYDLAGDPLVRLGTFSSAPDRHLLVFAIHHILTDGRSFERLTGEIAALYAATVHGQALPPVTDAPSYDAFVAWQRGYLASSVGADDDAFWQAMLQDVPTRLLSRRGRPPAAPRQCRGAVVCAPVPGDTWRSVAAVAASIGATPFAVLFGAYCLHLHEVFGQDDIVLGTGAPGLPGPAWRNAVGLFANMVPIHSSLTAGGTQADRLRAIADALFDALDHQLTPFNRILSAAAPSAAGDFRPLVQHVCTLWPRAAAPTFGGLAVADIDLPRTRSRFTTLAEFVLEGDRLTLRLEVDSDEMSIAEAQALVDAYLARLAALGQSLSHPLSRQTTRVGTINRSPEPPALPYVDSVLSAHVLAIWEQILQRRVEPRDQFFEMGGRSILAHAIATTLSRDLDVTVPTRLLFEHPTAEAFARAVAALVPDAGARLAARHEAPPVAFSGADDADAQVVPLTQAQLQVWIDERLSTDIVGDFSAVVVYRIRGPLDANALTQALQRVGSRHDLLRARLERGADGLPAWRIAPTAEIALERIDCGSVDAPLRQASALRLLRTAASRRITLQDSALHRFLLIRLAANEHFMLIGQHHLITDALSMRVLLSDLGRAYAAVRCGRAETEAPAPPPFAAVVAEEAAWLAGAEADRTRSIWQRVLAGARAIPLCTDNGRMRRDSLRTKICSAKLSEETTRALVQRARKQAASPFLVMLTGWFACLAEWHASRDLVVGLNAENRSPIEGAGVVGCFVNPIPVRACLADTRQFGDLLSCVTAAFHAAYAGQRLPFREIVRIAGARPQPRVMPLCRAIADWVEPEDAALHLVGCDSQLAYVPMGTNRFELALYGRIADDCLHLELEYAEDLWMQGTVAEQLTKVLALLEQAARGFDFEVWELQPRHADAVIHGQQTWWRQGVLGS